jgi:hypothetical protein
MTLAPDERRRLATLRGNPLDAGGRAVYLERFIHREIYRVLGRGCLHGPPWRGSSISKIEDLLAGTTTIHELDEVLDLDAGCVRIRSA